MSNHKYSPEFKDKAVRQMIEAGHSVSDVTARCRWEYALAWKTRLVTLFRGHTRGLIFRSQRQRYTTLKMSTFLQNRTFEKPRLVYFQCLFSATSGRPR